MLARLIGLPVFTWGIAMVCTDIAPVFLSIFESSSGEEINVLERSDGVGVQPVAPCRLLLGTTKNATPRGAAFLFQKAVRL